MYDQTGTFIGYGTLDYSAYAQPSATSNWGTVPTTSQTAFSVPDYFGAGTAAFVAGLGQVATNAGVTSSTILGAETSVAAHVIELPSIVGTAIAAAAIAHDVANGNYYDAGKTAASTVGSFVLADLGGSMGTAAAAFAGYEAAGLTAIATTSAAAGVGALAGAYVGAVAFDAAMDYASQHDLSVAYNAGAFTPVGSGYPFYEWGPVPAPSGIGLSQFAYDTWG